MEVLTAIGGVGNAVFIAGPSDSSAGAALGSVQEACIDIGWRPLVVTIDEEAEDHGYRPLDMALRASSAVLPGLLAERFHSGLPVHYLAIEDASIAGGLIASLASLGIRPWIIRQASVGFMPAGYQQVGVRGDSSWWIAAEHGHLAGGIATALSSSPEPPAPSRRTLTGRIRGRVLVAARRLIGALPASMTAPLVRRRHLAVVQANQGHLIDPAYLGRPSAREVDWITPQGLPAVPAAGLGLRPLGEADRAWIEQWLAQGPHDSDATLDRRMDNHGDELGRTIKALRSRLRIAPGADLGQPTTHVTGDRTIFDARCLQSPSFGTRGIGRFALAALVAVRETLPDSEIALLVDRSLEILPPDIAGECAQITRVTQQDASRFGVLIQPSPMTAEPRPLLPILHSDAHKVAVVFDFIPAHYPSVYLTHPAARAEYAACLDALALFDEFLCISQDTEQEMLEWLNTYDRQPGSYSTSVAWPEEIASATHGRRPPPSKREKGTGPIVVMTGDEGRKNTFGALAAVGAATAGGKAVRDVRVVGMPGNDVRIHHWAVAAAIRPGEAHTCERLSDQELQDLLESASVVVVASFDEGLSLPVIEAVRAGTPIIGSDIPTHRELIGVGSYLAPAGDIKAMARAIRQHRGSASTHEHQGQQLRRHAHVSLEGALRKSLKTSTTTQRLRQPNTGASSYRTNRHTTRLDIGIATPLPPQPTGVADFSAATIRELARLANVTVYTTPGGESIKGVEHPPVDRLLNGDHHHDVLISVVGNSHFHLPFVELLGVHDCVVIAHDTRMVEFYMALRSKGGAEQVMLRGQDSRTLYPSLDEQIDDMRLLQNAGLWEVAQQSTALILHSISAAPRIARETGIEPLVLPFANQRRPDVEAITADMKRAARSRLGFSDDVLHLATFGYVDIRTKMTDVVVEAAAWLTQWGYRVALHVVGSASPDQERSLTRRARAAGIEQFTITGFTLEDTYRNYLLAIDLGIQLRISPLLGVSGPLSDMSAFGSRALASNGLCVDVDAPPYVTRLPDEVSSLMVAEAAELAANAPEDAQLREAQRVTYLNGKTPELYARRLLDVLTEAANA